MTPDEMDKVLDAHFAAEAAHDLDGILATLTDDAVHDVVGFPAGDVIAGDRAAIAARYAQLFAGVVDAEVEPVSRRHGADFLVDECRYTGRTTTEFAGLPANRRVTFRLLHVCEFRDGRMSRENVWQGPPTVLE